MSCHGCQCGSDELQDEETLSEEQESSCCQSEDGCQSDDEESVQTSI